MIKRIKLSQVCILLLLLIVGAPSHAASNGTVKGTVKDAQTKEPLPYTNVLLKGTGLGAASDVEGVFTIQSVPPGTYTLRAGLIGYKNKEVTIEVKEGEVSKYNFILNPESIQGETVVVTAQAIGQQRAINEQLRSATIMSVVSAAKIQELPDANAAESVGRLPGVSLLREGGEGSKVVIRGLSPQYNQITIDGVEMSSNVSSSNNIFSTNASDLNVTGSSLGDRGTNLSMVSSNMLGGIEVIKAITPDMDAAVLGGVVNFDMRKASKSASDEENSPKLEILSQGSYNALKNTRDDYKFVVSVEKRFFDNSFGVFAQGSAEKRNLSANELGASYVLDEKLYDYQNPDGPFPTLSTLNLTDIFRKRERYGATVVLDFKHETGDIGFMNFFSSSDTRADSRSETADPKSTLYQLNYNMKAATTKLKTINNLLSIKQSIPLFEMKLKLSQSYSETRNPNDVTFSFWQGNAGLDFNMEKLSPIELAHHIIHDTSTQSGAYLSSITNSQTFSKEQSYTGSVDFLSDLTLSDLLTAKIKFGGTYQYRERSYDFNQTNGSTIYDGGDAIINDFRSVYPRLTTNGAGLGLANFVYDGYSYGKFLNGDYSLGYPLNVDLMMQLVPIANRNSSSTKIGGSYKGNTLASTVNDYSGHEVKSAAYVMTTINIAEEFTLLPGVRYQNLTTTYTAVRGEETGNGFVPNEVTRTQSHSYFLPMVHFSYKPLEWLQAHLAYTNTLNYPDYSVITPRYYIGTNFISYNNYTLKPATSENFDAILSVYNNGIGLFTVNGFVKRIKNLIFFSHTYITDVSAFPELHEPLRRTQLYDFTTYINSPYTVNVNGVEVDWQTHFWYLPAPFSGIVFNINYTHIFSDAKYPRTTKTFIPSEDGEHDITITNDTSYTARLLNQPKDILNSSVGYDYRGFSARLSLLYSDNIFKKPAFYLQERVISDKYVRWDLSVKQNLPWFGMELFFNLNNITGEDEVDLNPKTSFPASEQRYGMTADVGLRMNF
jgi:TonB-dependent receptor